MFSVSTMSLRGKLVLLVSSLLAAVALFLLLFFPSRMDRLARTWLERRAIGMASLLASSVAPGLEFDDKQLVAERLSALKTSPETLYALVRDGKGKPFAGFNLARTPEVGPILSDETFVETQKGTVYVVQPIRTQGGEKGALALAFRATDFEKEKVDYLWMVATVALGVFLVGVLGVIAVASFVAGPIRRAIELAQFIEEGDLASAELSLGGREEVFRLAEEDLSKGSKDEVALLTRSFARMLTSLRNTSSMLSDAVAVLSKSVINLSESAGQQRETINRQAKALHQTQVTAEEIKETAVLAAAQAQTVMEVAGRAEKVSSSGESAIELTLGGMNDVRGRVEDMASKIAELETRMQVIDGITQTVKEFANQSTVLAVNAAIEAARAAEHGKGFSVVAQEVRSLADQSIHATKQIRETISGVTNAVRTAVAMTLEGSRRIEGGLQQARASGESLRELSSIVRENGSAVRQIAVAVNQQSTGFGEIFNAVNDLSKLMQDAVRSVDSTRDAVRNLEAVSDQIVTVVRRYRL